MFFYDRSSCKFKLYTDFFLVCFQNSPSLVYHLKHFQSPDGVLKKIYSSLKKDTWSLLIGPTIPFQFLIFSSIYWNLILNQVQFLNVFDNCRYALDFLESKTSFLSLLGLGLNCIFNKNAH